MEHKQLVFVGKNVKFYSSTDEAIFYKWIKNINCIDNVTNDSDVFKFYLKDDSISNQNLDRLVGLFARYSIDTKQLKVFLNNKNQAWLKYWV